MIALAIYSSLLVGQAGLEENLVKLQEEFRRTMTNTSLMLGQAKTQKEALQVYEQGYTALTKIVTDATRWEQSAKSVNQKAQFGLLRFHGTATMLQDSAKLEDLTKSFIDTYKDTPILCTPIEELQFYKYLDADSFPKLEEWLSTSKSREVQASAALARVLKGLLSSEGDPNLLRSVGQQFADTKAGKRALRIFGIRTKLAIGQPMTDLELSIIGGKKLKLASLRGRIVLLDFWGFWSSTCNGERSELKGLAKDHATKLVIVGVNTDDWNSSFLAIKLNGEGVTWPNHSAGRISGEVPLDFGVTEYPSKIIVDSQGIVRYLPGSGNWREILASLLKT